MSETLLMLKTSFIGSHNNISIKISYGILEKKLEFMISIEFSSILMSLEGCFPLLLPPGVHASYKEYIYIYI